ncbi:MAG: polymer-forming cytoskeletal protein [Actinomycetota bacterium]|nr:polymer-forming cytoskeletal protein [Actinomycetota bacterium]
MTARFPGNWKWSGELIIQKNGYVNADVKTINAQVIGKYEGNMEAAENVEIKETGEVAGSIKTDSLIINKGGIFSGNVTRISSEQPESEPEPEPEPVDRDQEIDLEEPESDSEDLEL